MRREVIELSELKIGAARMLALKAAGQGREKIPVSEVLDEMNKIAQRKGRSPVGRSAIDSWLSGNPTRFDEHIILAWCDYLPCTVGQLLKYDDAQPFTVEDFDLGQQVAVVAAV